MDWPCGSGVLLVLYLFQELVRLNKNGDLLPPFTERAHEEALRENTYTVLTVLTSHMGETLLAQKPLGSVTDSSLLSSLPIDYFL